MVQSPYSSFKLDSQLTWRCNWWYQITGKAEKKDKNLVLVSQCPVGLSNTHPHPHTQKLGRPTKWLLWFNHLLLLLQRWPNPASNLPQACIQIFQVYCVEFFPSLLLKRQSRSPSACSWHLVTIMYGRTLRWQGRITALSNTGVTAPQNALHNQPYFNSWLFLKALWLHHDQGLPLSWWRIGCDFDMTWSQVVTKLPKIFRLLSEDINWTWEQVHQKSGQTCAWLTNNT